jgi:hypothetical protein
MQLLCNEELITGKKSEQQKWLSSEVLKKSGSKEILAKRIISVMNFGDNDV